MVGSHPVLGEWDVAAAPDMTWTDGHMWVSDLDVPDGADFEFKIVHLTYGGASWEPSANRCTRVGTTPCMSLNLLLCKTAASRPTSHSHGRPSEEKVVGADAVA